MDVREQMKKRIIKVAKKNTAFRAAVLVCIAVYLFCYHLICSTSFMTKKRALAVCCAIVLMTTTISAQALSTGGSLLSDADVSVQYSVNTTVTEPQETFATGYAIQPEYKIQITNTSDAAISDITIKSETAELAYLNEQGEEITVVQPTTDNSQTETENVPTTASGSATTTPTTASGSATTTPTTASGSATTTPTTASGSATTDPTTASGSATTDPTTASGSATTTPTTASGSATDVTQTIPQTLQVGQMITYVVRMPLGLAPGTYKEHITFAAKELTEPVVTELHLTIGDKTETTEKTDNPSTEQQTTPATEEQPKPDVQEPVAVTDSIAPTIKIVSRSGGYLMGGTFFATTKSVYELQVNDDQTMPDGSTSAGSGVQMVSYKWDGVSHEAAVENGYAQITMPESYNGGVEFYCKDQAGNQSQVLTDYLVSENSAPEITYSKVKSSTDDSELIRVNMKENGEVISGLNQYECFLDGKEYTGVNQTITKSSTLANGKSVPVNISFDIPLTDSNVHSVEVVAQDYSGNASDKTFRVRSSDTDIVSVVLPTTFGMNIFPSANAEDGNIFSDDIVVCNQSGFPVKVTLAKAEVVINHQKPDNGIINSRVAVGENSNGPIDLAKLNENTLKDAAINLHLLTAYKDEETIDLAEGMNADTTHFSLAAHNSTTDAKALQADKSEKQVNAPDYAIVKLRGRLSKGSEYMWKNGDIKVSLVFNFDKIQEDAK